MEEEASMLPPENLRLSRFIYEERISRAHNSRTTGSFARRGAPVVDLTLRLGRFMRSVATEARGSRHTRAVEPTLPAEAARVRELQQQGVLDALYVPEGSGAPDRLWAVFNGESRDAVERVIESLAGG
jgi:hypothetical protein